MGRKLKQAIRRETVNVLNAAKMGDYARCGKTKLVLNKNKKFNSKHQSVKQLCDRGKSLGDNSGFLFSSNTECDKIVTQNLGTIICSSNHTFKDCSESMICLTHFSADFYVSTFHSIFFPSFNFNILRVYFI